MNRLLGFCAARAMWASASFPGRWRVLRWATTNAAIYKGTPPRRVSMPGFDFLVSPEASLDVFLNGISPNSPIERTIRQFVKRDQHTLDVGANIGWTARLMSAIVGKCGSVHAFEPVPNALENLSLNVASAPATNIVVHPVAASDSTGEVDIYLSSERETALASLRQPDKDAPARGLRIRTVTIDSLMDQLATISFVKIDVEGAEYKVLRGMEQLIERDHPVLAIELSDDWLRRMGSSGDELLAWVRAHGYSTMAVGSQRLETLDQAPAKQIDIVCLPATPSMT